jgi:hypothetical protein
MMSVGCVDHGALQAYGKSARDHAGFGIVEGLGRVNTRVDCDPGGGHDVDRIPRIMT